MAGNQHTFRLQVAAFAEKMGIRLDLVARKVALTAFDSIVIRTPVDTGRARANWTMTIGSSRQSSAANETLFDKSGEMTRARAQAVLADYRCGPPIWISNTLPYIVPLEFGGYPDPVQFGSWVKGQGYVIKSDGGYSKQSPQGMVRLTVAELNASLAAAVAAAKQEVR